MGVTVEGPTYLSVKTVAIVGAGPSGLVAAK